MLESGKGGECVEHKFTQNGTCDDRDGRTNWHHGWKLHAYYGNIYALFLMEVIDDALQSIKASGEVDPSVLSKQLQQEEDDLFNAFEASDNFKYAHKWDLEGTELTTEMFYHHRVYCHSARLPAQTRYKGHVFDQNRDDNWHSDFKKGLSQSSLNLKPLPEMKLAYSPSEKHKCNETLHIDSRDYFFATYKYGDFQTIAVPNTAELKAYGLHQTKGYIAVCPAACTHSNCKALQLMGLRDINKVQLSNKEIFLQVNGEEVASAVPLDDCFLLKRSSGEYKWDPNSEGRYEIGFKILTSHRYFRISSFIVW